MNADESIKKVMNGDIEAYRDVVDTFEPRVRVVIASMIPEKHKIDDLTQETFIVAYKKLASYEIGTRFDSWISRIASNMAQNERRRWYKRQDLKSQYRAEIEKQVELTMNDMTASLRGNVLDALSSCIERLNDTARVLIDGFYFKRFSAKELAHDLNVSEGSIRISLYRARKAIAKCLESKGAMQTPMMRDEHV